MGSTAFLQSCSYVCIKCCAFAAKKNGAVVADAAPTAKSPTRRGRRRLDTAGKRNTVVTYRSIRATQPSQLSLKVVEIALRQALIGDQCAKHPEDLGLRHALA